MKLLFEIYPSVPEDIIFYQDNRLTAEYILSLISAACWKNSVFQLNIRTFLLVPPIAQK